MALRNYNGPLLPGDPAGPSPATAAPAPPPRAPEPAAVDALQPPPVDRAPHAPLLPEFAGLVVSISDTATGLEVIGHGPTVDDALAAAKAKYDAAQVQGLVWQDGSPVDGLARQVLIEALEMLDQLAANPPTVKLMIGRLKGALGEEME